MPAASRVHSSLFSLRRFIDDGRVPGEIYGRAFYGDTAIPAIFEQ
jgi:hypothetical protein